MQTVSGIGNRLDSGNHVGAVFFSLVNGHSGPWGSSGRDLYMVFWTRSAYRRELAQLTRDNIEHRHELSMMTTMSMLACLGHANLFIFQFQPSSGADSNSLSDK